MYIHVYSLVKRLVQMAGNRFETGTRLSLLLSINQAYYSLQGTKKTDRKILQKLQLFGVHQILSSKALISLEIIILQHFKFQSFAPVSDSSNTNSTT